MQPQYQSILARSYLLVGIRGLRATPQLAWQRRPMRWCLLARLPRRLRLCRRHTLSQRDGAAIFRSWQFPCLHYRRPQHTILLTRLPMTAVRRPRASFSLRQLLALSRHDSIEPSPSSTATRLLRISAFEDYCKVSPMPKNVPDAVTTSWTSACRLRARFVSIRRHTQLYIASPTLFMMPERR